MREVSKGSERSNSRYGYGLITAVSALALAVSPTASHPVAADKSPTAVAPPNQDPMLSTMEAQANAQNLAGRIIALYKRREGDGAFISDNKDPKLVDVNVQLRTEMPVDETHSAYGVFRMTATVHRSPIGALNASKVSAVSISEGLSRSDRQGAEPDPGLDYYGYTLSQDPDTGSWRLRVDDRAKVGVGHLQFDTSGTDPITEEFGYFLSRPALTQLDWAEGQPVDSPPVKGILAEG